MSRVAALLLLTAPAVGIAAQPDRREDEAVWRDPLDLAVERLAL
jgi:hypothetical protein